MPFELDSKESLDYHYRLIRSKRYLKNIYTDYYNRFKKSLASHKIIIEIGSGAGFIKEVIPKVLTSDVLPGKGIDCVFSATKIPFKNGEVSAFVMIDVLHHIKSPQRAIHEMDRCLTKRGKIIMIEPANSLMGRFIFQHFHHEKFAPDAGWNIKGEGRLSDANGAIPYIIFIRDRIIFEKKFPNLRIQNIKFHTPLRYITSGGLSKPQLLPSFTYPVILAVEWLLSPLNKYLGLFMTVEIEKI